MSRECEFCGKHTRSGNSVTHRGLAKYLGGVGRRTTGREKRKFKANIQKVRAEINGTVRRVKICTKCLRSGVVQKPMRRKQESEQSES